MAVKKCLVDNCDSCSTRKEDIGVTYHKFPKDPTSRENWTEVTRVNSSEIGLTSYVCSRHFRKSDFQSVENSKYVLKSDAVPSIFPWTSSMSITEDHSSTSMEAELSSEKLTNNDDQVDKILTSDVLEKDESLEPFQDNEEAVLKYSKDSEGENIESIKKFIEEQEKEILKLQAEVKPSTSKTDLQQSATKNDPETSIPSDVIQTTHITEEEQELETTIPVEMNEDVTAKADLNDKVQEPISVASSVIDIILSESEARLANKEGQKTEKQLVAPGKCLKANNSMALAVGSKVEAKDFSETWHPALISEVDYDEMEVLVHYEDVAKRTDEWINVSSPRLRPYSSPSPSTQTVATENAASEPAPSDHSAAPAKEAVKVEEKSKKVEFKVGDRCLARWRDNNRFMATIETDLGNGKYDVVFDDGFHWVCNVTRLSRMREPSLDTRPPQLDLGPSSPLATPSPGLTVIPGPYHTHLFDPARDYLGSKSERRERKRKLNIKEIFNIGQKKKKEDKPGEATRSRRRVKAERKPKVVENKSDVLLTVKCEPAAALPDAVAAIIGTVKVEESAAEEAKPKVEEVGVLESKDEVMVVDPTEMDLDDVVKEELVSEVSTEGSTPEPTTELQLETPQLETPKLEKFDLKREVSVSLDRMNLSQAKRETESPKRLTETGENKTDSASTPERDRKKSLSKIKKAKKLRLLQERKVKREVEKVKKEMEAMRTQLEEMKKQVGLKTEALYKKPEGLGSSQTSLMPGEWCCKWYNGQPVGAVFEEPTADKGGLPRLSVQVEDPRLPEGWTKHMVRRSLGTSAGKWDVVLVSPDNRRLHTKTDMRHYLEATNSEALKPFELVLMDFSVHRKLSRRLGWDSMSEEPSPQPDLQSSLPSGLLSSTSPIVKQKKLSLKRKPIKTTVPRKHSKKKRKPSSSALSHALAVEATPQSSALDPALAGPAFETPVLEDGYVWVGSLKVQVIDTLLRCPADGCFKNFRNNTLLQMHIKHYHRELRKMMGATPKVSDLAYARTAPVTESRQRYDGEPKVPKLKISKKRLEEPKPEPNTPEIQLDVTSTTPTKQEDKSNKEDSPRLRLALVGNKPLRRPRVLLPVRKTEDSPPQTLHEAYLEQEKKETAENEVNPPESFPVLDFENAISTHTVTKPPEKRKKGEKKKKTFATISKVKPDEDEDEDWYGANSDFDTQSSFPRSGTPDSKLMDKSAEGTPSAPVSTESVEEQKEPNVYMYTESGERVKIVHMKREEIINCHCGVREEDGLMIQCELCLCWQHALCHNIQKECEVPEKYTCSICLNPRRGRRSQRFLHDQDRLYEGLLPGARPCDTLKRSHELSGNLLRIDDALHALRVKYYVAAKKDHPKLYLWAKDWETSEPNFSPTKLNADYVDLNVMINEINKENLPLKPLKASDVHMSLGAPSEEQEGQREMGGLLSSPGAVSVDLPITTSDLERLASTVQAEAVQVTAPQPEAPIENSTCRQHLLRHIQRCQALIDARLDSIEAQVAELESQDPLFEDDETAHFFPRTKQTIQMMLRDLDTMEELGVIT